VEVRETAGSVENLRLLGQGDADVAIVQSGVAGAEDVQRLYALGSLYREPLWVFYCGDEPIDRLSRLAGKRIGVGPEGSGTHAVAMRMLAANGLAGGEAAAGDTPTRILTEDVGAAASALLVGELDAAFFVAAFDADYIRRLLGDGRVRLMSFGQHEA